MLNNQVLVNKVPTAKILNKKGVKMKQILKKFFVSSALALVVCSGTLYSVNAANWQYSDNVADLNYWDVQSWGVAYTGVTNKTGYNYFACVARGGESYECNESAATYNQYREFGLNDAFTRGHTHAVRNAWGSFDYPM